MLIRDADLQFHKYKKNSDDQITFYKQEITRATNQIKGAGSRETVEFRVNVFNKKNQYLIGKFENILLENENAQLKEELKLLR